eukprot:CAMPEP_0197396490 /NCGR_PEP_ID=MMETSP1165-20131217/9658_1 /TAXON_ID=284809 /ORGANISM="Chrysocystis fragilis, Strain CCMP3189" /LENGTH=232 /DNA_ID=CAMNT_0042922323 /DNA_START=38 /DNA_END=736 /DNA_ORIENTATION=-
MLLSLCLLVLAAVGSALSPGTTRRSFCGSATAALVCTGRVASAKSGEGARFGIPDESERDAALGARADSYGDYSRENSAYRKSLRPADEATITAKREKLVAARSRLEAKVGPALEKKQWSKIVDALNGEMFDFKTLLSDVTKARQGGKVCLVDPSQRGGIPKGLDPDDCPLQLVQVAVLQDVNDLFRLASSTRDLPKAQTAYSNFQKDIATFIAESAASSGSTTSARLDLSY